MVQIVMKPELHQFGSCKEFAEELQLCGEDLVLTNRYIYEPYFGPLGLDVKLLCQETYGTGEPTDIMAEQIIADAAGLGGYKRIIAIGGGTIIDIAKAMAVGSESGDMDELYRAMPELRKNCELIIVPTTCGTGSEMTNVAVFNRTRMGTKMGLVSEAMYADKAVLIPELLDSLPFSVFATSSIDALVHAVESCLSPKATIYTRTFGYQAIDMILSGYQKLTVSGPESRNALMEDFLIASNFAGISFGTAGCAAVHAMAYPLGGMYHVPHGESNYAIFTGVMKNYMEMNSDGELTVMNRRLAGLLHCSENRAFDCLEDLLNKVLPKKRLREYGVSRADLGEFSRSVMETQERLMANSYVPLDFDRVLKIYTELY